MWICPPAEIAHRIELGQKMSQNEYVPPSIAVAHGRDGLG
jgi:hypothetical protein